MSQVDICNEALGFLGSGKSINSLTEESREAKVCSQNYEPVRQALLRSTPWAFATKRKLLALIGTETVIDWAFTYEYPTDCLNPLQILTASRDTDPPPYEVGISDDNSKQQLYADIEQATLKYTANITSVEVFDDSFKLAFAYALAAAGGMQLTGDQELVRTMISLAGSTSSAAETTTLNEKTDDPEVAADWTQAR
jgi:hypothetical protein